MEIFKAISSIKSILESGCWNVDHVLIDRDVPREIYKPMYLNEKYNYCGIEICFDIFESRKKSKTLLLSVRR